MSDKGVFPDHEKLEAVERFLVPTAVKLVQEFLGFARYYLILSRSVEEHCDHLSQAFEPL